MLLEMHSHAAEFSSCSHVSAVALVRRACQLGLQGLVLTDHHHLWSVPELQRLRRRAGVPAHFLILSGQEVTTFDVGDVLVYGADATIRKGTPLPVIRARFPQAAIIWAHPYREQQHPTPERLLNPLLDGVEIFNANQTYLENTRGLRDWHRYRFTAVAGTDTHALNYAGTFPTLFDHPVDTVSALAAELRGGRCRPYFQEIPHSGSNIQLTELTLGPPGGAGEKIIVKELQAEKWVNADRSFHIIAELHRCGFPAGPFRVPRPLARDAESRTLVEQGIRGVSLYDELLQADPTRARHTVALAARWLARLHGMGLHITPPEEFLALEETLLGEFLAAFTAIDHRQSRRAREVLEHILQVERSLYRAHPERLVQGHGDFNPKNILFGQEDETGRFAAAIDFDYSCCMPPALDVGTMLAQLRHQLFRHPQVPTDEHEPLFLDAYRRAGGGRDPLFPVEVELFRARANLSIASYLIHVGLGSGEDIWRVLVEADRSMAQVAMHGY
jgi:3',5'-nucleoside bisphosphate phosphatase